MTRVFQIGFHVCGTRSLASFFRVNGFKHFHHENHQLAEQLFNNLKDGKTKFDSNFEGPFPGHQGAFYSDMQSWKPDRDGDYFNKLAAYTLFKEIDKGYPNSLFILNLRDKEAWINSKIAKGREGRYYKQPEKELTKLLSDEWDSHIENVRKYFKDSTHFIEFHITNDSINKVADWLEKFGLKIESRSFPKVRG